MIHPNDLPRWRAKIDQIAARAAQDGAITATWAEEDEERPRRDAEMRQIVEAFRSSEDLVTFRENVDEWCRRPGPYSSLDGPVQTWLNQFVKGIPEGDTGVVRAFAGVIATPASVDDSLAKIRELRMVTDALTSDNRLTGRIPWVLSLFWATDAVELRWPVMRTSATERMNELGWTRKWANEERWPQVVEIARAYDPQGVWRFDRLMGYLTEHRFVGLNPTLADTCREAASLIRSYDRASGYRDDETAMRAESLAYQIRGELAVAGKGLVDVLNAQLGRNFASYKIGPRIDFSRTGAFRADAYTVWATSDKGWVTSLRLWATQSGVALGVYAYANTEQGEDIAERIQPKVSPGMTYFRVEPHLTGDRLRPVDEYRTGDVFVGRSWTWGMVPQGSRLEDAVLADVEALLPVFDTLNGSTSSTSTDAAPEGEPVSDPGLAALVERFRAARAYPTEKDHWHVQEQARYADLLTPENLAVFDLSEFRRLVNGGGYGGPGPQSILNTSLSKMDSIALDDFARRLNEILWGDGTVAQRIDRALDWEDVGTKGLGESVVLKLFSIVQPDKFLPVFPLTGPNGKIAMLRRLGLPEPSSDLGRGAQHVEANDTLRRRLEPYFPGDPWGQGRFGYWLMQNEDDATGTEIDKLEETAAELFVQVAFLEEIKELLQEKGQVVFYGPPGTGKTYIADRFAAAIQPDPDRRMTVQFHPSMSYEDFFEGYRPRTDEVGQMSYELRKGPLALMAEKADAAPNVPHVLIIDEFNRANLPRVFGELLYLLEYRKKWIRTAYRADEPFELPENLYFIGTMNTADRSIAIIDAALRRRFHFIPFMPHEGPLAGVLPKWLKANDEPAWIAGLVDGVNDQLNVLLRGSHLLIGHSHFMVAGAAKGKPSVLTQERLRRIWDYGVYPMIEDQLHGRPDQLAQFTWRAVLDRYGPGTEPAEAAAQAAAGLDLTE